MINWWLVTTFFGLSWSSNHHFSWISKPALVCLWHGVFRLQIRSAGNWQEGSRACHFRCYLSSSSLFYPNRWHLCSSVRVASFIIFVKVTKLWFLGQDWSSWWWVNVYGSMLLQPPISVYSFWRYACSWVLEVPLCVLLSTTAQRNERFWRNQTSCVFVIAFNLKCVCFQ